MVVFAGTVARATCIRMLVNLIAALYVGGLNVVAYGTNYANTFADTSNFMVQVDLGSALSDGTVKVNGALTYKGKVVQTWSKVIPLPI